MMGRFSGLSNMKIFARLPNDTQCHFISCSDTAANQSYVTQCAYVLVMFVLEYLQFKKFVISSSI
jgi:hypothetical protein